VLNCRDHVLVRHRGDAAPLDPAYLRPLCGAMTLQCKPCTAAS